jgi:hypothetical protein
MSPLRWIDHSDADCVVAAKIQYDLAKQGRVERVHGVHQDRWNQEAAAERDRQP